ncbi:MAG: hypothetical protein ACOC9Y_01175 [Chloroflexota bacterium]
MPADERGDWIPASRERGNVRDESEADLAALREHFPTPRDAVAYIMETFPIVKRKDIQAHGHYRTKDTILEIYDAMQEAHPHRRALRDAPRPPAGRPLISA